MNLEPIIIIKSLAHWKSQISMLFNKIATDPSIKHPFTPNIPVITIELNTKLNSH